MSALVDHLAAAKHGQQPQYWKMIMICCSLQTSIFLQGLPSCRRYEYFWREPSCAAVVKGLTCLSRVNTLIVSFLSKSPAKIHNCSKVPAKPVECIAFPGFLCTGNEINTRRVERHLAFQLLGDKCLEEALIYWERLQMIWFELLPLLPLGLHSTWKPRWRHQKCSMEILIVELEWKVVSVRFITSNSCSHNFLFGMAKPNTQFSCKSSDLLAQSRSFLPIMQWPRTRVSRSEAGYRPFIQLVRYLQTLNLRARPFILWPRIFSCSFDLLYKSTISLIIVQHVKKELVLHTHSFWTHIERWFVQYLWHKGLTKPLLFSLVAQSARTCRHAFGNAVCIASRTKITSVVVCKTYKTSSEWKAWCLLKCISASWSHYFICC